MNRFALVVLFFSILLYPCTNLAAQNTIDSLQRIIDASDDQTTRLENTNHLAKAFLRKEQTDTAFALLQAAYAEADAVNHPFQVELYFSIAKVYELRELVDSAIQAYEQTRILAQQYKNDSYEALSLMEQGYHYSKKSDFQKGLELNKQALSVAEQADDPKVLLRVVNSLGRSYSFVAEFDSSSMYLQRAINIEREQLGADARKVFELYTNIGNNYGRSGQIEQAIRAFEKGLVLMLAEQDSNGICHSYRNIATAHYFSGSYPEALELLHKAVNLLEGSRLHDDQVANLDFLGEVYFTIEDYENAGLYWQKAIESWQAAHNDEDNADLLFKKGRVLLLQESYQEARTEFIRAVELKDAAGEFLDGDWYWHIGESCEKLEQFEQAAEYYNLAIENSPFNQSQFVIAKSQLGLGRISENRGSISQAKSYFQEAYQLAGEIKLKDIEMETAAGLYRIFKGERNDGQALRYLEASKAIQDSLFNEKNTQEITRMQADFEFEQEKQEIAYTQAQELERQSNIRRILWGALAVTAVLLFIAMLYFRNKQKANEHLSKLNAEISAQKEKLEEMDESKSRFFTNISHEFRTPLTIIKGMSERVLDKPEVHLEKGVQMIRRNALNLLNLVNQILDLRKLESKELKLNQQQGDVIAYLKYIMESHSSHAEQEGLLLRFETEVDNLTMDYDAEKVLRVVSNLLSNAVKFTPAGGHIFFRLGQGTIQGQDALQIEVEDTGIGIAPENLPYIFDRFYQEDDSATRVGEGTGIGLALSQELVKLMGGSIKATSEVNQGSVFTVLLPITNTALAQDQHLDDQTAGIPLLEAKADQQIVRTTPATASQSGKQKLLIVEDNLDVQQYLIAALEDYYDIDLAENGTIGIEKATATIPDLIISDVMMPETDGYELTDTLKQDERTNHIPIILLTAKSDVDSKISGLEKGADAYLAKPFEERELFVRIDKLLELRKKLQERYTNLDPSASAPKIENPFLLKLIAYIEEHLSEAELNMERLSKDLGMSRTQVFRKLKALTGQSPTLFIRSYRLKKGKELLATTDLTISEIAYEVGFTSLNYFSSAFSKEFGTRPSEFRK
ncbi:MAG: tetratricopeptide repeat protein [Bacteroidota bacterium]